MPRIGIIQKTKTNLFPLHRRDWLTHSLGVRGRSQTSTIHCYGKWAIEILDHFGSIHFVWLYIADSSHTLKLMRDSKNPKMLTDPERSSEIFFCSYSAAHSSLIIRLGSADVQTPREFSALECICNKSTPSHRKLHSRSSELRGSHLIQLKFNSENSKHKLWASQNLAQSTCRAFKMENKPRYREPKFTVWRPGHISKNALTRQTVSDLNARDWKFQTTSLRRFMLHYISKKNNQWWDWIHSSAFVAHSNELAQTWWYVRFRVRGLNKWIFWYPRNHPSIVIILDILFPHTGKRLY